MQTAPPGLEAVLPALLVIDPRFFGVDRLVHDNHLGASVERLESHRHP
jgi:hypothetical protein